MDFSPRSSLRPVNAKCLECHTTFAKNTALYGMGNAYDKTRVIYGIDCERCHGPSGEHAVFHRNHPNVSEPKYMVKHDTLSQHQRLDACALCHSGVRSNSKPAFHFLTGDNLTEHSLPDTTTPIEEVDVHGNQYALLQASQCFKQTATMDCSTCHDPHKNQRNETAFLNSKCIQCHQKNTITCKEEATVMAQFGNNCISCHMPLRSSSSMFVRQEGDSVKTPVEVRTHLISVYPEEK
ncbi:multiheme c-type cytochrome, partial [Pricia sp.]|uniref:multiheme c-type cytochrome n=1 Tax=Pricia sp. TaxID=2268138 RepID=UPI0035947ED8